MTRGWRHVWLALAVGLAAVTAGWAQPQTETRISPKAIRDGVRVAVEGQLTALREGNFSVAYHYAATALKRQFDERLFTLMIRRGYPALLRHETADIGVVRDNREGVAQVVVTLTDALKRDTVYRYWLVEEGSGWRVTGVVLEQRPARGDI